MGYDRVRASLDRHATYIVATCVAGATQQELTAQRDSAWQAQNQPGGVRGSHGQRIL